MKGLKLITAAISLIFFCFLASSNVFAECTADRCDGLIEELFYNNAGNLFIATDGDEANLDCDSAGDIYVMLDKNDQYFDRKLAMLLTASSASQEVGIRINNGSTNCTVNYVVVNSN